MTLSLTRHNAIVGFTPLGTYMAQATVEDMVIDAVRGGTGPRGSGRGGGHDGGGRGGNHPYSPRRRKPRLLPLIEQLYILGKDRGLIRLGDTVTRRDGTTGPVMNYAQLAVIRDAEHQLATRGQIRAIMLKARQIGISTIIEAIAFVLTQLHRDFSALIVSHEAKSTRGILNMTKRYWSTYVFRDQAAPSRYDSAFHVSWTSGSEIQVATAKNLDAGRSSTLHFLHASEVAFWPEPETLFNGLRQAIPNFGLSAIFLESTANGIGNFFHTQCNLAMRGESEYHFHFFPWHKHPEYTAAFIPQEEADKYEHLGDLSQEERDLIKHHGVDASRLMWRRWAITNLCMGDIDKFHQEYPSTPHEAFVSTGRNVFPFDDLLAHYDPLIGKRGRLVQTPRGIQFRDDPHGPLTIFSEPSADQDWGVYIAGADPTHTTAGDYACIQVFNRRTLEQVAVYRRKIDPTTFGKDLMMLGYYYNTALLAPERTGPGYATVGVIAASDYPNVYVTQNVTRSQGQPVDGFGWVTGQSTKHLAVSHVVAALAEPVTQVGNHRSGVIIHDEQTFTEMRDYVTTEDGRGYKNGDGSLFDDGVMAFAIGLAVHNIEPPPPPYEMVREDRPPRTATAALTGSGPRITSGHRRPIDHQPTDTRVGEPGPAYQGPETDHRGVITPDMDDSVVDPYATPDTPTAPWEHWTPIEGDD